MCKCRPCSGAAYNWKEKGVIVNKILNCLQEKKIWICSCVYALLFSASIIAGSKLESMEEGLPLSLGLKDLGIFLVWFIIIAIAAAVVSGALFLRAGGEAREKKFSIRFWAVKSAVMFLCWFPYLLIFYPGNLSVDSYWSLQQILGNSPLNNAHPILYTGFVGIFVKLGMLIKDIEFGIALYSAAQMLILSVVFGGLIEWFRKRGAGLILQVLATCFFALNPLIAMYSVTMWKDILFSTWIVLLVCFLYSAIQQDAQVFCRRKTKAVLAVLCILIAFGRNNGIYIVILALACLLLFYRKVWKKLILTFAGIIAFIYIVQGPVYSLAGVEKGNLAESLAVPLQQIAYTVKNDGYITEEQKAFLNNILPLDEMKKAYLPHSVNGVKFDPEFDNEYLEEHFGEFIKVWAQMLPHNFGKYVKAYLMHTSGYWHVGTSDWRCIYGVIDSPGIESSDLLREMTGMDLRERINDMIEPEESVLKDNVLYSIGASVWLVLFTAFFFLCSERKERLLCLIPLLGNWATIMIAVPTHCEFRYMFCFHLAIPFMVLMLFERQKKNRGTAGSISKDEKNFELTGK